MPSPGGILENIGSTPRTKWTPSQITAAVPSSRGQFTFPAPYYTRAWRVTDSTDTGGQDGVDYNGYSYWTKMNCHVNSNLMKILVGLNVNRGGDGANIYQLNKDTGVLTKLGWLFSAGSLWRNVIPEMWYWSLSNPDRLYLIDWHKTASQGDLQVMNVVTGNITPVFDVSAKYGNANAIVRQCHSSANDVHHAGTLFLSTFTQANIIGAFYYNSSTDTFRVYPKSGNFDECNIDKTGRYTILSEVVIATGRIQQRVFDNTTGSIVATIPYTSGALAHLDTGYNYIVGTNSQQFQPNSVQSFSLPSVTGSSTLHYSFDFTQAIMQHMSHCNASASGTQFFCGSNADTTAYQNEIVCARTDAFSKQLVVAPVMTNTTTGGGFDDYGRRPKGCLDVTGRYFLWTTNLGGSSRLDAFLVEVPIEQLIPTGSAADQVLRFTWNANSDEATDVAEYRIEWGDTETGPFTNSFTVSVVQATSGGSPRGWSITPTTLPSSFPRDGVYWFRLRAVDAALNMSTPTAAVAKRVVRVKSQIKTRK